MLIYHPAFDNYHCIVRLIKILNNIPIHKYSYDRIRIYDYYLLFPNELRKVTLPTPWGSYKNIKPENKYNKVQNSQETFKRLYGYQSLAFKALSSYNIIDNQLLKEDVILRTDVPYPDMLSLDSIEIRLIEFFNSYANKISLKELKERTKLMQFRHELS
jgi:hypothetical protein